MTRERGLQRRQGQAIARGDSFTMFEHFEMCEDAIKVHGEPSLSAFQRVVDFAKMTHKASGWWLVDLIEYGDSRPDLRELVDDILDHEAMSESTKKQYRYLGKALPQEQRVAGVPFGHHTVVASMEPGEKVEWLEEARDRGWSQSDLRKQIRAASRTKIIKGQAVLEGKYRVIYADPPWKYSDSAPTADGSLGKAERSYEGMTIEELCRLPVEAHSMPNAVLFMWATTPLLMQNPGPREVLEAWGFTYKSEWIWDKVLGMPGSYSHVIHESLLICTRGMGQFDDPVDLPKSIFRFRRKGEHSEKPPEFRQEILKRYTTGPYLELFGRKPVPGWSVFGNDARLWADQAKPEHTMPLDEVPF